MTILSAAPGILTRAFGMPAVEYREKKTDDWADLPSAHYGSEVAAFVADDERAQEAESYELQMTVAESAPRLAQGWQVRIGGETGRVYAVRNELDNSHHGVVSYALSRTQATRWTHDRGATA